MKKQRVLSVLVVMFVVCLSLAGMAYANDFTCDQGSCTFEGSFRLNGYSSFDWSTSKSAYNRNIGWETFGDYYDDDCDPKMAYVKYYRNISSGESNCGSSYVGNCRIPDGDGKTNEKITIYFDQADKCDGYIHFQFEYECHIPKNPVNLTYSFSANDIVTLKWDSAQYATKYELHRDGEDGEKIVYKGPLTSYTEQALLPAGEYYYYIESLSDDCDPNGIYGDTIIHDIYVVVIRAPIAKTEPVDTYNITENSATLKAVINPQAAATTYYFEYGTTTSYGSKTPSVIINDTEDNDVDYDLTRLTPNTTYHFRVVASNSKGTTYGNDQTFTTKPAQQVEIGSLTVTILPAEAITAGAMWQVDGGAWNNSGATVPNLSVGSHTVNFKDVAGWTKPSSRTVTIENGDTTTATGTYIKIEVPKLDAATIQAIAAGANHTIVITTDGSVWAWGSNGSGQLGIGTDSYTPVKVTGISGVKAVAAGYYHTLALTDDGSVWAWGYNSDGQIGIGGAEHHSYYRPVKVTGISGVKAVAAGDRYTIALTEDGSVYTWGYNYHGQLGNGTTTNVLTPEKVSALSNVIAVDASNEHTVALTEDGSVWTWGYNYHGQLGNGTTTDSHTPVKVTGISGVKAVAADANNTIALTNDGDVWTWGNFWGLGTGATTHSHIPVKVAGISGVKAVAAGDSEKLVLTNDGELYAWGGNSNGELGIGTRATGITPVKVTGISGVKAIAAGGYHALALTNDGLYAWGNNEYGQLGNGISPLTYSKPNKIPNLSNIKTIAAGRDHTIAVTNDGDVYSWGFIRAGEYNYTPVKTMSDVKAVAAGDSEKLVLTNDGEIYTWGIFNKPPSKVPNIYGADSIAGGVGGRPILLALTNDGDVYAWGYDYYGRLGIGTTGNIEIPVKVTGISRVQAFDLGSFHTVALTNDGDVYTWGSNWNGQLGIGTTTNSYIPVKVTGISGVKAVAAGGSYTIALTTDGCVWDWGYGSYGSNVIGTYGYYNTNYTPAKVTSIFGIKAVAAGGSYSGHSVVIITDDGDIYTWGDNSYGQLGDGTRGYRRSDTPYKVTEISGVESVAAGDSHTLAITTNGDVYAWGRNNAGQLGIGTATVSTVPIKVVQATGGTKPTAITGDAGSVTATTATLSGTLNPNGIATSYYFEYGTTTSYGSKTPAADGGSGTTIKTVTANLTDLTANTTYHFRLVATNSVGTTNGNDQTFTTVQQVGSLTVTISPSAAVNAGAQWQIDSGAWNNSDATVSNLTVGNHTVEFKDVTGWTKPAGQTVTISNGQTATATGTYTQQVGSLTVTISPAAAVTAGAQWKVDNAAWNNSDVTVSNFTVGIHTVEFKDVTGWTKPAGQTVTISNGQTATATGTYTQQVGSLTVTISPSAAVNAGAQWQIDSGAWNNSDATVSNLTVGNHTVEFKDVTGWTKPASQTVTISNGQTATATGTYTQQFGSLTVTISPANAVTAGAQWQVDGGAWNNSSATVSTLTVGNHTVSFKDVTGWTKPASQTVTISNGQTATATGTYTQQFGSLTVTISPSAAVTAGAQWQVDGGAWNNSSATVSNLTVGNHTVEFKDVTGWTKPAGQTVTISNGQTATATGTYISLGTKPTATTGTATSTTATTATLNGTLNPNGLSTNCYFEYGLTTSYGKVTATQSKGLGTTSTAVTANITGLTAATAYHFRVVATNSAGTTYGSDGTFTTTEAIAIKLVPVPDTGITKCYNDSVEIPCPTAGQDFYGQDANYSINPMSYTKLDATGNALPVNATTWAMVRDNVTGLIWENKTDDGSIHDKDNTYTWYDSNNSSNPGTPGDGTDTEDFIKALNDAKFGGYSDWRLPTIKELGSIVDYSIPYPGPTVNTIYFKDMISNFYWSGTSKITDSYVRGIEFDGSNDNGYRTSAEQYGLAVRGSGTLNNLVINGDGTVTDTSTGLMWQQDTAKTATGGNTMVWKDALSYCENLSLGGYTDWRLPTIKELRSIVDYSHNAPAINITVFGDTNSDYYCSSSTAANKTSYERGIEFSIGYDFYYSYMGKNSNLYVRAVRSEQSVIGSFGNLTILPTSRSVVSSSGTTTFAVSNTGTGTMAWSASVTSGSDWLSITSGSSGSNSGTITCSYQANTTTSSRTGTIRVTANGAAGSPVDVTVVQAAGGTKPTSTTGDASSITATTATLSGTLNPNGIATSYYFEYGTTTSYGSKTPAADGGSDTTIKTVTANISGLTAGTTYHFRLVGTNSAGTTNGSDKSFTTTVNPATDDYGNNCTAAQVVTLNSTTNGKIEVAGDYDYFKVTLPSQGTLKVYTSGSLDTLGYLKDSACTDISDDDDDGDSLNFLISEDLSAGIYYIGVKSYETKTGDYTLNVEFISVTAVGSLQVTILPANAVNAGAMWRVDAGVWNNSGATVLNITVGTHTVDFKDVAGWTKPANQTVTISNGQTATATGTYISLGTKPTATTGTATSTTATTATLNGTLNPNGLSTNCYFEYGLTTAYGKVTATQSKGSGTTSTAVTAAVTGLTANTTYHFRLVGTNSAGTTYSSDKTFTTTTAIVTKPTATTGVASLITDNSAKLSGTITPKGASTTYYFEYGTTTTYGKKTAIFDAGSGTAAVAVNADLVGFNAGTTYHFRLVATNSAGTAYGTDKTFTTTVPPTTVLKPTVTTEPATSIITTSAKLNGTVNPNGDVTNYYFEYGTTTSYGSTTRSPRSGSDRASFSVNKSITGLAKATIYHFRIVAVNSAGTTYGVDKTFTTLP